MTKMMSIFAMMFLALFAVVANAQAQAAVPTRVEIAPTAKIRSPWQFAQTYDTDGARYVDYSFEYEGNPPRGYDKVLDAKHPNAKLYAGMYTVTRLSGDQKSLTHPSRRPFQRLSNYNGRVSTAGILPVAPKPRSIVTKATASSLSPTATASDVEAYVYRHQLALQQCYFSLQREFSQRKVSVSFTVTPDHKQIDFADDVDSAATPNGDKDFRACWAQEMQAGQMPWVGQPTNVSVKLVFGEPYDPKSASNDFPLPPPPPAEHSAFVMWCRSAMANHPFAYYGAWLTMAAGILAFVLWLWFRYDPLPDESQRLLPAPVLINSEAVREICWDLKQAVLAARDESERHKSAQAAAMASEPGKIIVGIPLCI